MATRDITTAVQGNLEDDVVYPFFAVELLFDDNPLRLWTGLGTLVYDGNSWAGTGNLLDVSSCTLSGSAGDETVTVVMTGTLKAGDYIQLGSGSAAKLHQVLQDQSGDGTLEIWPGLRSDYTTEAVIFSNPKGVFRLKENMSSWNINNASAYSISFEAVEAIT